MESTRRLRSLGFATLAVTVATSWVLKASPAAAQAPWIDRVGVRSEFPWEPAPDVGGVPFPTMPATTPSMPLAMPQQAYPQQPAMPGYAQPMIQAPQQQQQQQPMVAPSRAAIQPAPQAAIPGYAQPPVAAYAQPPVAAYAQPTVQAYSQPAIPSYSQPAVPTYAQPAVSGYAQPTAQPQPRLAMHPPRMVPEAVPQPAPRDVAPTLPQPGMPQPAGMPALPDESVLLPGQEPMPAGVCGQLDGGCPGYRLYAIADALFMARYDAVGNRPLVFNEDTGATLLSTSALQWGFSPGFRAFFGERRPGNCGWEVGYLGLYGLDSSAQVVGPGNLIAPGDVGANASQFNSADLMNFTSASTLNMAEANLFHYDCCGSGPCQGACQPPCQGNACQPQCGGCRCIDWLAGFRWAGLQESADFASTCCGLTETSVYGVATNSNLFGGQVGVRARQDYGQWACEGWLKLGLAGVWMNQTQSPILDFETGIPYRDGSSSSASGLAGFADANASTIYKFNRIWGLRLGLNAIWLGNVALAPNQWDFSQTSAVTTILPGSLFLVGANVGVEARW